MKKRNSGHSLAKNLLFEAYEAGTRALRPGIAFRKAMPQGGKFFFFILDHPQPSINKLKRTPHSTCTCYMCACACACACPLCEMGKRMDDRSPPPCDLCAGFSVDVVGDSSRGRPPNGGLAKHEPSSTWPRSPRRRSGPRVLRFPQLTPSRSTPFTRLL